MLSRASLNTVITEMKLDNKQTRTRGLAVKWGAYQAKQEFVEFKKLILESGKELKKHHGFKSIFGNLFDVIFISTFGSLDAVYTATIKTIQGLAGAVFHPALAIKKSKDSIYSYSPSTSSSKSNYSTQISSSQDSSTVDSKTA